MSWRGRRARTRSSSASAAEGAPAPCGGPQARGREGQLGRDAVEGQGPRRRRARVLPQCCRQVAEVTMEAGKVKVDRIVAAVDCGIGRQPRQRRGASRRRHRLRLSAVMRNKITLKDGEVEQANFDAYEPLAYRDAQGRGAFGRLDRPRRRGSANPAFHALPPRSPTPSSMPPASVCARCRSTPMP